MHGPLYSPREVHESAQQHPLLLGNPVPLVTEFEPFGKEVCIRQDRVPHKRWSSANLFEAVYTGPSGEVYFLDTVP